MQAKLLCCKIKVSAWDHNYQQQVYVSMQTGNKKDKDMCATFPCAVIVYVCVCVCINTCTYVSACVRDNSVAEGIQSPPPPWEIKALSAAQDVESEVIHTQGPGLPARGASALVSTSNSQSTQFTFKELGKKIENFALWNLFSAFCVLLANNASSYQTFWT